MKLFSPDARRIEAYTQARYVDYESVTVIDEAAAVRVLEDELGEVRGLPGTSCAYLGILWFEVSFQADEDQRACLLRARIWLFRARSRCQTSWQSVEQRIEDLDSLIER